MKHEQAISLIVNATYSREWQGNNKLEEARQMSIDALTKQMPMKPGQVEMDYIGRARLVCGNCGEAITDAFWDYCPRCGQRIGG